MTIRALIVGMTLLAATACRDSSAKSESPKPVPAATVSNGGIKEGDLATIRLTAEAEKRLGIQTVAAKETTLARTRVYAGECVVPPGQSVAVAAPVGGTLTSVAAVPGARIKKGATLFTLSPMAGVQRDLKATAEADVAAARARVEGAQLRLTRATQLLRDEVGSVRQKEQAEEELRVAQVALDVAGTRLKQIERAPLDADSIVTIAAPRDGIVRLLSVQPGQMVPGGAPLAEVAQLDELWLRVPVYAGEVRDINPGASVEVRALGQTAGRTILTATPVAAPPSADPLSSTVDLYYRATGLRPGERVSVTVPMRGTDSGLTVPASAVVYDYHGGSWVYERTGPQAYTRRRVDVPRVGGGAALVARGLKPGSEIVTAGVAELFGIEFGPGK